MPGQTALTNSDTVKIACVGGGPAGLYFALELKNRQPRHDITIFERGVPGATRGWGVVFWGDLLDKLYRTEPDAARAIEGASYAWDRQVVDLQDEQVTAAAPRGYGIRRQRLIEILARQAQAAGVRIEFGREITDPAQLPEADLIVACDGVGSRMRQRCENIRTDVRRGGNKYLWLGTDQVFRAFTFPFVRTDSGWIWAHAYGVAADSSTFIVECSAQTFAGLGFDTMPPDDCLRRLEKIFAGPLDGHQLIGPASWLSFRTVTSDPWHDGRVVLAGDAAHTTHFTIGSGTKLAIEDAIALADQLERHDQVETALRAYESERQAAILPAQLGARLSAQWFEHVPRYAGLGPRPFATLLRRRRSPLLPHIPPALAYWLYPTSRELPAVRRLRRWAGPKVIGACTSLSRRR